MNLLTLMNVVTLFSQTCINLADVTTQNKFYCIKILDKSTMFYLTHYRSCKRESR